MKRLLLFLPILLLLTGSCHKKDIAPTLVGKVVINAVCNQVAVQVLVPTDASRVAQIWKDPGSDTTYQHVFEVSNSCDFRKLGIPVGGKFSFSYGSVEDLRDVSCMVCQVYTPMPPVRNYIVNIKRLE